MSSVSVFFLLVISPILAMLLALLGVETIPTNPLGWFLFLVGVTYSAGVIIVYFVRKERFWEPAVERSMTHEEHSDHSFWFIALGMSAAFFLSPVEYLYFPTCLPRNSWMSTLGTVQVTLGIVVFIWARRTLGTHYSGHLSTKIGQTLVQTGPYRFIRHPAYAGYLLMALGISLGYSSLIGLISVLMLLLPSLIFRIAVEEKLLIEHFGDAYRLYRHKTKRLVPGIW